MLVCEVYALGSGKVASRPEFERELWLCVVFSTLESYTYQMTNHMERTRFKICHPQCTCHYMRWLA